MLRNLILIGLSSFTSGCLATLEKAIVYQPVRSEPYSKSPVTLRQTEFVDVRIPIANDQTLHGLLAEAKEPRCVVLYCHGNGGNVENCISTLRMMRDDLQVSILAFDYRGYGQSADGEPSEDSLYEDARLARKWLAKKCNVAEKDIVLFGYSLGGGVAVELAAKDGARALILDRTFTSIPDVAQETIPFLPMHWLLESQYDSLSKIPRYRGPLLQLHGDEDEVVPFKFGRKLFEAANEPKQFINLRGGRHNDLPDGDTIRPLKAFVEGLNDSP